MVAVAKGGGGVEFPVLSVPRKQAGHRNSLGADGADGLPIGGHWCPLLVINAIEVPEIVLKVLMEPVDRAAVCMYIPIVAGNTFCGPPLTFTAIRPRCHQNAPCVRTAPEGGWTAWAHQHFDWLWGWNLCMLRRPTVDVSDDDGTSFFANNLQARGGDFSPSVGWAVLLCFAGGVQERFWMASSR